MKNFLLALTLGLLLVAGAFAQGPSAPPTPTLCATGTLAVTGASANQPLPGVVTFTGAVAANVLTTSSVTGTLVIGQTVTGTNVPPNTKILKQLTGSAGGAGTYSLSLDPTVVSTITAEAMTAVNALCNAVTYLNDGSNEIFFTTGGSSVTATTTASGTTVALPAGQSITLSFPTNAPYVAAITASSTSTLRLLQFN